MTANRSWQQGWVCGYHFVSFFLTHGGKWIIGKIHASSLKVDDCVIGKLNRDPIILLIRVGERSNSLSTLELRFQLFKRSNISAYPHSPNCWLRYSAGRSYGHRCSIRLECTLKRLLLNSLKQWQSAFFWFIYLRLSEAIKSFGRSSVVIIITPEIQLASVAVFLENVTTLQTGISRQFFHLEKFV